MGVAELGPTAYGKSAVRLVKVLPGDRETVKEISIDVHFEGEFAEAHVMGDNRLVLPTDTMKNTVYCLARDRPFEEIEELGLTLIGHFLSDEQVSRVKVGLVERPWEPIPTRLESSAHAFLRRGEELRTALVTAGPEGTSIEAGLEGLPVLKTKGSAFSGFRRDRFTTLGETEDRLLATVIEAHWSYVGPGVAYGRLWNEVRRVLLEAFAGHRESRSLQHTAYAMGEAVLEAHPEIDQVRLSLPNKHHLMVDLSPFGLDNPDEVFTPIDEPYGLIEVTVRRTGGSRGS
jgi:urate oxidase